LSPFEVAAVVIVLAAGLGYLNHRLVRLPHSSGLTAMGMLASLVIVLVDRIVPGAGLSRSLEAFLERVDFHKTLMDGMLSFLLFAGALHVNLRELKRSWQPILALSTVGVVISTVLVGWGVAVIARLGGLQIPLSWCMVFGALISPTDPVAVLSLLRQGRIDPTLKATVGGESLFNDGIGVVVFTILLAAASDPRIVSVTSFLTMFAAEAGGGAALGLGIGWLAYRLMRSIDDYSLEVLISLAVVMGGYVLADRLGASGPVAMVVAGLIMGGQAADDSMSDVTRDYLIKFWTVVDEILNAALFVLIGLEAVALTQNLSLLATAVLAIPLVLAVRLLSAGGLLAFWRRLLPWPMATALLTWGGLRGGISVALALSLPPSPAKTFLVVATYLVVLFAVVIQGPSVGPLLKRFDKP
jgi:CPA1 family monovalent cation:H+ antiporter